MLGWSKCGSTLLPYLSSHHNTTCDDNDNTGDDTETDVSFVKRDVIQVWYVQSVLSLCLSAYVFDAVGLAAGRASGL